MYRYFFPEYAVLFLMACHVEKCVIDRVGKMKCPAGIIFQSTAGALRSESSGML